MPLRMGELRGAIIGTGYFAQFHAEAWSRMAGVRLFAAADVNEIRAWEFAKRWGIRKSYADAEEMLERERPEFVDIVTRPETHRPLTELAARRGAHVICQKPMAPTLPDCIAMVRACETAGVRLVIHENWRWQPWYREVRRLTDKGRFGTPFHLGFLMRTGDGRGSTAYRVQPYFRDMPRLLIYETFVHFLDTYRYLAGEIESLYCITRRVNPNIRGEDCATVQLRFRSGAGGLIDGNRISGPVTPPLAFGEFRLEGDRAAVRVTPDGDIRIHEDGDDEREHVFAKSDAGYKGDSVKAMQEHFISCLHSGRPAESEGEEYLKTVALVETCYRSAESGRVEVLA
jgi:D-apiose dehydrogenase